MEHSYSCVMVSSKGKEPFVYTSDHRAGSKANIEDAELQYRFMHDDVSWCEAEKDSIYKIDDIDW